MIIQEKIKHLSESRYSSILIHVLIWGIIITLLSILVKPEENYKGLFLFRTILIVFFYYFNSLILLPKILWKGKWKEYLVTIVILFISFWLIIVHINKVSEREIIFHIKPGTEQQKIIKILEEHGIDEKFVNRDALVSNIVSNRQHRWLKKPQRVAALLFLVIALSTSITLIQLWYKSEKQRKESDHEKLNAELNFLKSQVNPHFLFNTLNGIYSLANKRSEKTANAIARLSNILRYMLYETDNKTVNLQSEYDYIADYIDLQKIRHYNNVDIKFETNGDLLKFKIAPLLLVPFIENAFKHGIDTVSDCFIYISLITGDSYIKFSVKNSVPNKESYPKENESGIGLQNVKRRLNLLYPESYSLNINQQHNMFSIELMINFHDEVYYS